LKRLLPYRFPERKKYSEDYHLWLDLILRGNVAYSINAVLAYTYKGDFGDGGLSGKLWRMERGELDSLRSAKMNQLVCRTEYGIACTVALIKFGLRTIHSLRLRK